MSSIWKWCRDTFELSRGNRENIRSMEGMRGLAVTAVFFVHYTTLCLPYASKSGLAPVLQALYRMGNIGVDLFFVLSGYLIYSAALKRPKYAQFMKRRIRRIYPTFLAVFSVYLLLSFALPHESKIPSGFWPAAAHIAANALLLPGLFPIERIINAAWSLSYEMLYYLLIPLLVLALELHRRRRGQRIALLLALAAIAAVASSFLGGPVRAIMFLGGAALYDAKEQPLHVPFVAPVALIAAFSSMLLFPSGTPAREAMHAALLFVALPVFCFACFARPSSATTRWLSAWPIRWLGNMSYSYYLLHGLVLKAAFLALTHWRAPTGHEWALAVVLLLPVFLLTIVVSAALFVTVERPFSLRSEPQEVKLRVLN
jgi:peptidoglycan/LPS O-acetylase OafA/YrhL